MSRYRRWPERAVERRMTRQQIELYFHWWQRDLARQRRIDKGVIIDALIEAGKATGFLK